MTRIPIRLHLLGAAMAALLLLAGCPMGPMPIKPDPPVEDGVLRAKATQLLEKMAANPDQPRLRANAVEGLAVGLGTEAADRLQRAAEDESPMVRSVALMSMGDLRLEAGRQTGRRLLNDRSIGVQISAAYAMTMAGDKIKAAMDVLPRALENPKDPDGQGQAAMVLGKLAPVLDEQTRLASIQMLEPLAQSADAPQVRVQALGAQAALGSRTAVRSLRRLLVSQGGDMRMEALVQLGAIPGNQVAQESLLSMLDDDFPGARMIAALSLARHKISRQSFATQLSEAYRQAWFFSQGRGADYRSMLYFEGNDKVPAEPPENILRMRLPAIRAAGAIGEPPTGGLLMRLMDDSDESIQAAAAAAALEYLRLPLAERHGEAAMRSW